jgi:lambda family phage portal protein
MSKPTIDATTGALNLNPKAETKSRPRNGFFDGAKVDRFTNDWITSNASADSLLEKDLTRLRARAKSLVKNDGYSQSALRQTVTNVVGENGYRLKVNAQNKRGGPDKAASKAVLDAWRDFCKAENYTVTQKVSEQAFDCLMVKSIFTGGGGLARIAKGFKGNSYRYALQGIPIERLDPEFFDARSGVSMSVQRDSFDRETYYHILKQHPGDGYGHFGKASGERIAYPADQIIHPFIADEFGQSQGEPWLTPVIPRIRQLHGYEEAELIAARAHASKLGFFEQSWESGGYEGEGTDELGNITMDGKPGSFETLAPGVTANLIDPSHPNGNYPDFRKGILRGIASGIVTNYNILAEDLEGVSYSSIRQGTLSERDAWKMIQRWYIDSVKKPIFSDWLEWVLMTGKIGYSMTDYDRLNRPEFQGRRWEWVDPLKDSKAEQTRLEMGLSSHQRIARSRGEDLEEIHEEISQDRQLDFFKQLEESKKANPKE